jgi:hypothetical protein
MVVIRTLGVATTLEEKCMKRLDISKELNSSRRSSTVETLNLI